MKKPTVAAKKTGSIVWGVDLEDKDPRDFRKMAAILDVWNENRAKIVPLNILGPLERSQAIAIQKVMDSNSASEHFNSLLQQGTTGKVENLKTVFLKGGNQKLMPVFLEAAKNCGAEMVAVQTHSRRGLKRFQLGSFAEKLIGSSSLPVISANPGTRVPSAISTIVLAVKLESRAGRTFKTVLRWAKERGAVLRLCHKFETPPLVGAYGAFGLVVDAKTNQILVNDALALARRRMKSLVETAKKFGVRCEGHIINEPVRVAESVMSVASEHNADIIVMATRLGPLGQKLIGSAAREVLTTASCPVIVIHEGKG
ncbi:MAG: universal stress protein [Bdellovibrionales bacterium]